MTNKEQLWQEMLQAGRVLKSFPRLANGLTPDAVKFSAEYKAAKAAYQRAFDAVRRAA